MMPQHIPFDNHKNMMVMKGTPHPAHAVQQIHYIVKNSMMQCYQVAVRKKLLLHAITYIIKCFVSKKQNITTFLIAH